MVISKNVARPHQQLKKRSRTKSSRLIHVTIRQTPAGDNQSSSLNKTGPLRPTQIVSFSQKPSNNLHNSTLFSSQIKSTELDRTDCAYSHHRKKKKKFHRRQYVCLTIVPSIIASILISIILPVLLIKNSSKKDPQYFDEIHQEQDQTVVCLFDSVGNSVVSYPSGSILASGNGTSYTNRQLNNPMGLYYYSFSNALIIGNYGAHNIVQWMLNANGWTLIAGGLNGSYGTTSTLLTYPVGVTVDPIGNMYVTDSGNYRVQFFLRGQSKGTTIAGVTGVSGTNATLLITPVGV